MQWTRRLRLCLDLLVIGGAPLTSVVMRKSIRRLLVIAGIISVLLAYAGARAQATRAASRDIAAFFGDFRKGGATLIDNRLEHLAQPRDVALAIASRHMAAITNYNYSSNSPSLNIMLNRTEAGVSWHLTIVFAKRVGGWYVLRFDEYVQQPGKA